MMLTLSRKPGQKLVIDLGQQQSIEILVTEIRGQQVKLAIDAPVHLKVMREELLNRPQAVAPTSQVA
jgi:carbon storage regulator CsrA